LKDAAQMKKADRGSYDFREDVTSSTIVARWQDNSVVTIASNTLLFNQSHMLGVGQLQKTVKYQ